MAALIEDNAWLREAAELAWTQGMAQPDIDMIALNVDTVSDRHLEALHALFVQDATPARASDILSGVAAPMTTEEPADEEAPAPLHARLHAHLHRRLTATARHAARLTAACKPRPHVAPSGGDGAAGARRAELLQALLAWCRTSGKVSLPPLHWDDIPDVPADAPGTTVDTGYVGPDPSGRIACRDLPRLQSRALSEVGFLFGTYNCSCWYWCESLCMRLQSLLLPEWHASF